MTAPVLGTTERQRWESWTDYLNAPGLRRGCLGYRVREAMTAGYTRREIAAMLHCSPDYVSRLFHSVR